MKLYSVKDWNKHYENNRTRELKRLDWVPVPINHDGDGYTLLTSHDDAAALLGCWLAIIQVAAKCDPRGTLLRRGGIPHNADSLARITRLPEDAIQRALDVCELECNWLKTEELEIECGITAVKCEVPATGCLEGKGREGKGSYIVERRILDHLNQRTGHDYRAVDSNLKIISARLSEVDGDEAGVIQVIDSKVTEWSTDSVMRKFLRPETLFGKEKFAGYWGQRNRSVTPPTPTNPVDKIKDLARRGQIAV